MTASDGFYEKAFLKNFVIFTGGKDPVRSSCPEVLGKKGVPRTSANDCSWKYVHETEKN